MATITIDQNSKRQMAVNIVSSVCNYGLAVAITFFLTPYIISKLGTAAYGFLGLSNNIIAYAALITVALNSMSGRFITLKYHEGNIHEANRYLSSTYFANLAFALFTTLLLGGCTFFLEGLINIPPNLVADVKFLFVLLFVNQSLSLLSGVFGISTFIKNRLDWENVRGMIGTILRTVLLIVMYGFFPAQLWYFGLTAIVCTLYVAFVNWRFYCRLTPELAISRKTFDMTHVWELTKAGAWNLLSSLSNILNQGFELLLANIFVGAYAMGILSITKALPLLILGIFGTLANNFAPVYVKLYADKDFDELRRKLLQSVRILGLLSSIPIAVIFSYGDMFYANWLPDENIRLLYWLTAVSFVGTQFALPSESLWYIFTLTNRVKRASINLIENASLTFIIVVIGLFFIEVDTLKLFWIISVRTVLGMCRCLTFLPIYGAKVLDFPRFTFYRPILRSVLSSLTLIAMSLLFRHFCLIGSGWISLIVGCSVTVIIGLTVNLRIALNPSDRAWLVNFINRKLHKQ